jgi:hypothetical protein
VLGAAMAGAALLGIALALRRASDGAPAPALPLGPAALACALSIALVLAIDRFF